ncbi:type VII secretion-associated serine protease mycosin [Luedemannella flava]|uniref:Type VII secretion-associated serine protease mycosin n=2 Tax=Luedemannella flava TaxID=349316 RepID=A0ABP4YFR9_9ACTN
MNFPICRRAAATLVATLVGLGSLTNPAAAADWITDGQWYVDFLKLHEVHKITKGGGVTVAVIDTGVGHHSDLSGRVLPGVDFVEKGGDGRIDVLGHGTGMAGLIAGHGRVLGVAPEADILPVTVTVERSADGRAMTDGIDWAVAHGAKVINISLGGNDFSGLKDAIDRAIAADVLVVAGAGNRDQGLTVGYPGAYPEVLTVGGVDANGNHSTISVDGYQLDISAPSDRISSTGPRGTYRLGTGTSDATALVSGAAALVRAKYPELSAAEVVHRLTATATDKGPPGRDDKYGYGVLDVVRALTADVPPETTAPPAQPPGSGDGPSPVVIVLATVGGVALIAIIVGVALARRRDKG